MLISIFVALIAIVLKSSGDPVYVDELAQLVEDKTDIWDLEELKSDDDMTRWAKFRRLRRILLRQSSEIKSKYWEKIMEKKRLHDEDIEEKIHRASDPKIKEFWYEIQKLDTNRNISESDAAEQEFQVRPTTHR